MAKEMIKSAKENGASLAKFQLYDAEDDKGTSHYRWVKDHELTFEQAKELFDYGESIGMEVFFSVFGVKYVEWCEKIGVKRYKIACGVSSGDILGAIIATEKPMIISRNGHEFWSAHDTIYCIPKYPAQISDYKDMNELNYDGLSDHTIGLDLCEIWLARHSRTTIEKHFVLKHNSQFPDDKWSMTPSELKELVRWENVCREVL